MSSVVCIVFCSIVTCKKNKVVAWVISSLTAFLLIYLHSSLLTPEVLRGISCFFGGAFTYYLFVNTPTLNLNITIGTTIEILLLSMIIVVVQSTFDHRSSVASALFMVTVFCFFRVWCHIKNTKTQTISNGWQTIIFNIYDSCSHPFLPNFYCNNHSKNNKLTIRPYDDGFRYLNGNSNVNNIIVLIIILIVTAISGVTYKYIELAGQNINSRSKKNKNTDKYNVESKVQVSDV